MKQIAKYALSAFILGSVACYAVDSTQTSPFRKTLSSATPAELPATAATLVKQAKARDWGSRTVQVVTDAVTINPAAAPAIVGAIAKAVPDMASIAAGTAAAQQPDQAAAIAKAATAAAPSKAGRIAAAVCRAAPKNYRSIALAVSEAAPTAGKEILSGVASAVPQLKTTIDKSIAGVNGAGSIQVAAALDQATTAAGPLPKGPIQGPPYVAPSGTPTTITPATSGEQPPGGREYSAP